MQLRFRKASDTQAEPIRLGREGPNVVKREMDIADLHKQVHGISYGPSTRTCCFKYSYASYTLVGLMKRIMKALNKATSARGAEDCNSA